MKWLMWAAVAAVGVWLILARAHQTAIWGWPPHVLRL
jgi:hypothetical protein